MTNEEKSRCTNYLKLKEGGIMLEEQNQLQGRTRLGIEADPSPADI